MPPSLLADLAVLLARSPEDVATQALTLILNRSPAALGAMNRLLSDWCNSSIPIVLRWRAQVAGGDDARTDMEGNRADDQVVAILENKFWAGITPNQPSTYLERLPKDCGIVAFVVPSVRLEVLKIEIADRVRAHEGTTPQFRSMGKTHAATLASGRIVVVTSWDSVLSVIGTALEAAQEYDSVKDLEQLQGLCERMDSTGFRPFTATDITSNAPVLELQCCRLIDRSVELMLKRNTANKKGTKAASGQGWHGHYLRVHGFGCQIIYSAWRWSRLGISPVWFRVSSSEWKFPKDLRSLLSAVISDPTWIDEVRDSDWQGLWLPIRLLQGREEDVVLKDMMRQLEAIARVLSTRPARDGAIDPPAIVDELLPLP